MVSVSGFSVYTSLPALHGVDVDQRVPVVGRAVGDDVDVLAIQQLAIVLVDVGLAAERVLDLFGMLQVDIADGHHVAQLGGLAGDGAAPAAHADARRRGADRSSTSARRPERRRR